MSKSKPITGAKPEPVPAPVALAEPVPTRDVMNAILAQTSELSAFVGEVDAELQGFLQFENDREKARQLLLFHLAHAVDMLESVTLNTAGFTMRDMERLIAEYRAVIATANGGAL